MAIKVKGLRQVYQSGICCGLFARTKPNVAVENLTFGVNKGE